jgi:hypothetical protein
MNKNLDNLKEQYEKLGKEIKALESVSNEYALDKLPSGTLVNYWDFTFDPKCVQLLEGVNNNLKYSYKVGQSWWKYIKPASHPWIGYKPGTDSRPPIHKEQLIQIHTRGGDTSEPLPAGRFDWGWLDSRGDIVAYRVVTTEEEA